MRSNACGASIRVCRKEKEALEESLEVSRFWTWIWFIAFAALVVVGLVRLGRWIGS